MYLYKKNDKSITVYDFVPNKLELIELKKRYLNDIKSVIVHVNDDEVLKKPIVGFNELDCKDDKGNINYIEETKNDEIISSYINGEFDEMYPTRVYGNYPFSKPAFRKSTFSNDLYNEDSTLLFGGYHYHHEYVSDEGILLTGFLGCVHPLFTNDINDFLKESLLYDIDEEIINLFKIFNCKKERVISLDNLLFLSDNDLISFNYNFQDAIEKSEEVLNSYNKVKKIIKKSNYKL